MAEKLKFSSWPPKEIRNKKKIPMFCYVQKMFSNIQLSKRTFSKKILTTKFHENQAALQVQELLQALPLVQTHGLGRVMFELQVIPGRVSSFGKKTRKLWESNTWKASESPQCFSCEMDVHCLNSIHLKLMSSHKPHQGGTDTYIRENVTGWRKKSGQEIFI